MESPLIYVMILLLNVFEFSSGTVYNKREKENHFACSSEEVSTDNQIIKLFLSMDSLKVYCFFRSKNQDTSRALLSVFTSGGLAPKLIISNSTYQDYFQFNLSLFNNRALWFIDIPRESITVNTDIAAVEEWKIKVTMHGGLNIYDTEGTLLDLVREPILQWTLGSEISNSQLQTVFPHVIDIKVAKCPCANDVALFGFILNSTFNGLTRYTKSGRFLDNIFTLYYDHLGFIHKLTPERFDTDTSSSGSGTSSTVFGMPPDLGFDTALAPQYLSPNEMIFFAYVPLNESKTKIYKRKFKNIHVGKVINYRRNGIAYIKKLLVHTNGPLGFQSSVIAELIEPFGVDKFDDSASVDGDLTISYTGNTFYHIEITSPGLYAQFSGADIEKTVVRPGYSSFMITEIIDIKNVLSMATMPDKIKSPLKFPEKSWFLFSLGSTKGRNWTINLKPCNYWVQQDEREIVSLNAVKYLDVGNKENYELKLIPNTRGMKLLQVPPVIVAVGNPALLEVKMEGYFDVTDSYHVNAHVASKFFHKGSTSLAVIMWEGSTSCSVTTMLPIMKSSCSYLKTLHHIPGRQIPPADWISGVHKDSQGFNMIKTLPINYRPPSNMGISIPLTDNIYHADPSKPRPRSLFHKSKVTGIFKQCTNVSSREMCNCTEHQKFSHAVAFSDCKEKVHRFKFPVTQYPVALEIFTESEKFSVEPPYLVTMTEVNMRQNWQLKHNMPENVKKMKDYLEPLLKTPVYNPLGLNISIMGSELFHFKVSVVPGVSFCNLEEEFQIYVDEVPLPFPGHILIAVATSVILGGLFFVAFIFRLRNIHPLRAFQRYVRGNIANPSTMSISS
ncbi:cation channel sperm-associated protein subunit beta-like [Onychomys torridus]|uniref:cation channel sperm-associated protein subunit beta-like n=1 Tax=Onychomys torridus TaxID=38674 RepID=UPI00167F5291|nr:cation channel sperm-associated protein subunit beta-like [Onychomys torridus]